MYMGAHTMDDAHLNKRLGRPPLGLSWRSSYWFTTAMVSLGITTDLLVCTIIIPVMPFHLERLHYKHVSALTGWLLFAYSAGLVLSTIPIAVFSERYSTRRFPLIFGLVLLSGSQILLMEAPNYAIMCIARLLQGITSSIVWVVGLALLCDATPESLIGRQLGVAMGGLSIGSLIGPPVGGALFTRFGYRGPFIFGVGVTILDLIARLLIIERKDALRWGVDPKALKDISSQKKHKDDDLNSIPTRNTDETSEASIRGQTIEMSLMGTDDAPISPITESQHKPISLPVVIIRLGQSSRALIAFVLTFVYGVIYTSQEPTLPLHLQKVWGLNSAKVGLVFLASVVPTLFSTPLTGWYSDKKGSEWVTFVCLVLALPWWVIVSIQGPLVLFVAAYALENFFTSGVISPLTAELAQIAQGIEGVGYAHVYGAFNVAYGLGSTVGPLVGSQIYEHTKKGWMILCLLSTSLVALCIVLAFFYTGGNPLGQRLRKYRYRGVHIALSP